MAISCAANTEDKRNREHDRKTAVLNLVSWATRRHVRRLNLFLVRNYDIDRFRSFEEMLLFEIAGILMASAAHESHHPKKPSTACHDRCASHFGFEFSWKPLKDCLFN
jgi:hypothetical protein